MKIGDMEVYGIIYKITNKINNKVYIGQTTKGFNKRYGYKGTGIERVYKCLEYSKNLNVHYNKYLFYSIEKYGFENFEVDEIIDYAFNKNELDNKEKYYIDYYDSFNNGYNNNLGGDGNYGHIGLNGVDNPHSRSVIQLSLEGQLIKEWDYMSEVKNILNIDYSKISDCANKKRRSAGGFIWVYKDEYEVDKDYSYIPYKQETKPIVKLSLNGEFVERYNSLAEISLLDKDINFRGVSKCCLGERKSYKGFIWVLEEKYNSQHSYQYNAKSSGKSKPILVYDKNMNYITTCNSISEIQKKFGYGRTTIRNHMNNKGKIKEHILIYKEELEIK